MKACRNHSDNVQLTKCGLSSGPKGKTYFWCLMFLYVLFCEIIEHKKCPSCQVNFFTNVRSNQEIVNCLRTEFIVHCVFCQNLLAVIVDFYMHSLHAETGWSIGTVIRYVD